VIKTFSLVLLSIFFVFLGYSIFVLGITEGILPFEGMSPYRQFFVLIAVFDVLVGGPWLAFMLVKSIEEICVKHRKNKKTS